MLLIASRGPSSQYDRVEPRRNPHLIEFHPRQPLLFKANRPLSLGERNSLMHRMLLLNALLLLSE